MKNEATLEKANIEGAPQVELAETGGKPGFGDSSYYQTSVNKRHLPQWALAWMVLVPALIFLVIFMIYPIINAITIAFIQDFSWSAGAGSFSISNVIAVYRDSTIVGPDGNFIYEGTLPTLGFGNFAILFGPDTWAFELGGFGRSLLNTGLLVIVSVPVTILVSLAISGLLNSIKVLRGFFQTIFFLPYVTNTIAIGAVFNALFFTNGGAVNVILSTIWSWFGAEFTPIAWIDDSASYLAAGLVILLYSVWNGLAFKILVFMGGLATIDKQYYDAAKVDGAKGGTIFRRITLPLLSPQVLYITITSFIGAFKAYTGVKAVFVGGSGSAAAYYFGGKFGKLWQTTVGWIYEKIYDANVGVAAAGSLTLLVVILIITLVQFLVSNRRVHY